MLHQQPLTNVLFPLSILLFLFTPGLSGSELRADFSPVYLTLSSLYRENIHSTLLIDREVQIHWVNGTADKIVLYNEIPSPNVEPKCFVETNITFGNPSFPGGWEKDAEQAPVPGDHCLPLYVEAYKNGLAYSDCLKIKPTWMQDNRLALESMNITSLFLPGTHNSGSYKRGETLSQRDTSGRYILTQDQSIWNQLVYGIRYLDLRIGYYSTKRNSSDSSESDDSFWINHDLIKVRQLLPILEDIKTFLKRTKDEILIIDLHRFPLGFHGRPNRHQHLVRLLDRELREYALEYEKDYIPTLGAIWDREKRIILSYGEGNVAREYDWLWPPIRQLWGNKQTVETLYDYLNTCMMSDSLQEGERGMWAGMAQLTPGPLDLLLNPKGSLRQMAHEVNRHLSNWCRDCWWDKANILAMDFFLGTDVINTAVMTNVIKGSAAKQYSTY